MTDATATNGAMVPVSDNLPVPVSSNALAAFEAMISTVPDSGDDAMESILSQIGSAQSAADLDAPWRSDGLGAWNGRPLRFLAIRKLPSRFSEGLPWFLVCDVADPSTGETLTVTTSSAGVVAQLVKAYQIGAFPFTATPRQAANPSRSGFYPMHLEIDRPRGR